LPCRQEPEEHDSDGEISSIDGEGASEDEEDEEDEDDYYDDYKGGYDPEVERMYRG
jgi:hypothetical protein